MRVALTLCALAVSPFLSGCAVNAGTGQGCTTGMVMNLNPMDATADHAQAPPGNQVKFQAVVAPTAPPACALPAWLISATPAWTSSDPKDISIDSSSDPATNGTAVCTGSTSGPATLTATFTLGGNTLTKTATLTCK